MKKKIFTITGVVLALAFWFLESGIHYFLLGDLSFEVIPHDFNDLWKRTVIVTLFILFGAFSDSFSKNVMIKEKQQEVVHVYNEMLNASREVLNNLLKQMQLFKSEAQRSKDFDQDVLKLFDNAVEEASKLADTLSRVEDMARQSSKTPG